VGTPAEPSIAERAETLELARAIVDAVRNDESGPLEAPDLLMRKAVNESQWRIDGSDKIALESWMERIDLETFRLAQDLVAEHERHAALRAELHRLRIRWNAENGYVSDRRFVESVIALLDAEDS
jgi:hypothetical protein